MPPAPPADVAGGDADVADRSADEEDEAAGTEDDFGMFTAVTPIAPIAAAAAAAVPRGPLVGRATAGRSRWNLVTFRHLAQRSL